MNKILDEFEATLKTAESIYEDAINKAIEIEDKIIQFYKTAAEQSASLMADVPRTFTQITKKRAHRIEKLRLQTT